MQQLQLDRRRALPGNIRSYQIKNLQDNHREILRRLTLGQTATEIARALNCTTAVISYVRNSILGQDELVGLQAGRNEATKDLSIQIRDASPEAFGTLLELQRDESTPKALKARICMDTLDRGGYSPIKKNLNLNGQMTESQLNNIKQRAKINGLKNGNVVEAEVLDN